MEYIVVQPLSYPKGWATSGGLLVVPDKVTGFLFGRLANELVSGYTQPACTGIYHAARRQQRY
jgi:hypothetical protein